VTSYAKGQILLGENPCLLSCFFFVLSAVLLEKVENVKSTTYHAKRAQKVHNFPDDLTTKISTTNSTTNHKKTHKKTTTFRLKEHNFPDHFCTTASQGKNKNI